MPPVNEKHPTIFVKINSEINVCIALMLFDFEGIRRVWQTAPSLDPFRDARC